MKVLITGVTGFAGSHLADFLLKRGGVEVHGIDRWRSKLENIEHLKEKILLHECDIRDLSSIVGVLEKVQPDRIFHLAGQSFVPFSWSAPAETLSTNILGELNLFEALRKIGLNPRVQVAGSSEEYGLVHPEELPIRETNPLRPLSPYAVSKVGQDFLGYQYFMSYKMHIIRTRGFNHCVSKWTPLLVRDQASGLIDIRYISEFRRYKPTGYMGGQTLPDGTVVWDLRRHPIEVWCRDHWTKAKEISCHPIRDGRLYRIFTKSSAIEVTGSHAILDHEGRPLTVRDVIIGNRLHLSRVPSSEGMWVHPEAAWLLGLFVAEGCVTTGRVRIDNSDRALLEQAKGYLLKHFGQDSYFISSEAGVWRLTVRKPEKFAAWLGPQIYASDRNKRVPKSILNAQREAKRAFLDGYNAGDGLRQGYGADHFKNFKTKSPILASGLHFLVANTTRQEICLNREIRNEHLYYSLNLNSSIPEHQNWGSHLALTDGFVKLFEEVPYTEEVWDIATEEQWFSAGIGLLVAHNTGPRRGEVFAESGFARQIARIEKGLQEPVLRVGSLDPKRDYTDVRDMVEAYWLALEKGAPGEVYNICSGQARSIRQVLEMLLSMISLKIQVVEDPEKFRPSDVPYLLGDCSKFSQVAGWKPRIPFETTLRDLLEYWRQRIASQPSSSG